MPDNDFCVFCEIIAGRMDASIVYEDGEVMAFLDLFPINPGHTLVIPKTHSAELAGVDISESLRAFSVAQRIAGALRKCGVRCEGVNFFLADGEAAGQEVHHAHMHVIPRYRGDGFGLQIANKEMAQRDALNETAERIRGSL